MSSLLGKMNRLIIATMLIFAGVSATGCVDGQTPREAPAGAEVPLPASRRAGKETRDAGVPAGVRALTEAYPDFFDRNSFKDNTLTTKDGTRLTWDDGREKDFVGRLDDCDIEDMFVGRYYVPDGEPAYLSDVGRGRNDKLFKTMYGSSAAEVTRNLVNVKWADGKTVRFTRVNGAADSLQAVARELSGHPELQKYLPCSGTFYWRKVRGADRQSAHSYGIAIDIAVPSSDYWLWKNPRAGETDHIAYANRIPRQIVEIFQRHGFIWGGAWYHYDTMHFEFRPELLAYAK